MPEAAEVEVAAAQLHHVIAGRVLESLEVTHPRTVRHTDLAALETFGGSVVHGVVRHGKWIVVDLGDERPRLGIHLRMSGQVLVAGTGTAGGRLDPAGASGRTGDLDHIHARLVFGHRNGDVPEVTARAVPVQPTPAPPAVGPGTGPDPVAIWFRDPRTFGELRPFAGAPVATDLNDAALTATALGRAAAGRRAAVKSFLLDQRLAVAGIGSYLADEALHAAGIDPRVPAGQLATSAWDRILDGCRTVMRASAGLGGVTLADEGWVDLWGRPGRYGHCLRVHAHTDCGSCGDSLHRTRLSGRTAVWCARCQHPRRRR